MPLFNWKCVNEVYSTEGSSFFGQIPSFRPSKWPFFLKIFISVLVLFCVGIQICVNFCSFFIRNSSTSRTLQPNSIVLASEMAFFFLKFFFRCAFFSLKFKFMQIYASFWLEVGQRARLHMRFIIFQPNSIVSASEMAFF